MKDQEDYPFCLDCFRSAAPSDWDKPDAQEGMETYKEGEERGNKLWSARAKNGFKFIILYRDTGEEWDEVRSWN